MFDLAKAMGTSIDMIERHYGSRLQGAAAGIASRLAAFEAEQDSRASRGKLMGQVDVLDVIGPVSWNGDTREPLGAGRWCGKNDNSDGHGFTLVRQDGRERYECSACCWAIVNHGLWSDDGDGYDVDEIRRRQFDAPSAC